MAGTNKHEARSAVGAAKPPTAGAVSADALLACAHTLADLAAGEVLPYFRRRMEVENKAGPGAFDPVTTADKAAERVIRAALARIYPDHGILGEEYANAASTSRYTWIIDPIDGTRSFIMGYPMWGTLICLAVDGAPAIGIIDQSYAGERYWGAEGVSHMRTRAGLQRLATRRCGRLEDALFATTTPDMFKTPFERKRYEAVRSRARMTRFGGDCYAYAMLAAGHVDVVVECSLKPFDIGALVPVVEGAGGRITGWDGGPPLANSRIVATGDPVLHEQMLALLA